MRKNGKQKQTVVFGGAGFIGSNVAHALLSQGRRVLVFDSLARAGVQKNLRWLQETHGPLVDVQLGDVRDESAVRGAIRNADQVFHFAAQVAVTTSLTGPVHDFEVNARGTLNVLEAIRKVDPQLPVLFTSTNKVYGGLEDVKFEVSGKRYAPVDPALRERGISEKRPLDFESPYGCSKGAADQYVLDYARSFGMRTAVFRMSCIYGPRQFGNEDQGWVAHFVLRALAGSPITIYGDGMQVRDILYVEDLVRAFQLGMEHIDGIRGQAFNIGGGPERSVSLLELIDLIADAVGTRPTLAFDQWRTGDQRYYVSDTSKFRAATGWEPRVNVREGVAGLTTWLTQLTEEQAQHVPTAAEAVAS